MEFIDAVRANDVAEESIEKEGKKKRIQVVLVYRINF